jgi:hypothetical protein
MAMVALLEDHQQHIRIFKDTICTAGGAGIGEAAIRVKG